MTFCLKIVFTNQSRFTFISNVASFLDILSISSCRTMLLSRPPSPLSEKKRNTPKGEKCAINNWVQVSSAELIIYSILYSTLALHFQR